MLLSNACLIHPTPSMLSDLSSLEKISHSSTTPNHGITLDTSLRTADNTFVA